MFWFHKSKLEIGRRSAHHRAHREHREELFTAKNAENAGLRFIDMLTCLPTRKGGWHPPVQAGNHPGRGGSSMPARFPYLPMRSPPRHHSLFKRPALPPGQPRRLASPQPTALRNLIRPLNSPQATNLPTSHCHPSKRRGAGEGSNAQSLRTPPLRPYHRHARIYVTETPPPQPPFSGWGG